MKQGNVVEGGVEDSCLEACSLVDFDWDGHRKVVLLEQHMDVLYSVYVPAEDEEREKGGTKGKGGA